MANEERIAHHNVAGLSRKEFLASKEEHPIFGSQGRGYFTEKCQEQEDADRRLLNSKQITEEQFENRQEQREKALEVLGTPEYIISYYLLSRTEDKELADAFQAATPDLLLTFASLVSIVYSTQYRFNLKASTRYSMSEASMEYILEQSEYMRYGTFYEILNIVRNFTPEKQNVILYSALFALLDHQPERLTPEQIEMIQRRKDEYMKRIANDTPKKTHFEILDIHFQYAYIKNCDVIEDSAELSRILAGCKAELETQINKAVAKKEGREADPVKNRTSEEDTEIQVDELERLREMAENLPQETEEEKKNQEDILHRINALCVLTNPSRASLYYHLISKNPELREIFIDASPKLMDKTINSLCVFARLNDKMQEFGLDSIEDIDQEIKREYEDNSKYGSNDGEIRKAKDDFALETFIRNSHDCSRLLRNMVLCSTLVELYKYQDSGLTERQKEIIEQKVAFHNQRAQNESQQKPHSLYDRLELTTAKGYDIGALVKPDHELPEADMPPELYGGEIFQKVWERTNANIDPEQRGVKHNLELHQEMQNECNSILDAQLIYKDAEARCIYNAALDHSNYVIREIARNLSKADIKILQKSLRRTTTLLDSLLFALEGRGALLCLALEGRKATEQHVRQARYDSLQDPDRTKWEPLISELFESSGLIKKYHPELYKDTSWFTYITYTLPSSIRNITHAITEYFYPEPVQPRGHYARLGRSEYYGEEIPEPPQQMPERDTEAESEPENPNDPQPEIGAHSEPESPPETIDGANSTGVAPQQGTHQSQ